MRISSMMCRSGDGWVCQLINNMVLPNPLLCAIMCIRWVVTIHPARPASATSVDVSARTVSGLGWNHGATGVPGGRPSRGENHIYIFFNRLHLVSPTLLTLSLCVNGNRTMRTWRERNVGGVGNMNMAKKKKHPVGHVITCGQCLICKMALSSLLAQDGQAILTDCPDRKK